MRYNSETDEVSPPATAEFFDTVALATSKATQRDFAQSSLCSIKEEMGTNGTPTCYNALIRPMERE